MKLSLSVLAFLSILSLSQIERVKADESAGAFLKDDQSELLMVRASLKYGLTFIYRCSR